MPTFDIGGISFSCSAVSIMQCWVGIGWYAHGSQEDIQEFRLFSDHFFPFLLSQDTETQIQDFCKKAIAKIDEILQLHQLRTQFISNFAIRLKGRLNDANQCRATQFAQEYEKLLHTWLSSAIGGCGQIAGQLLREWGLTPPYKGLGAVGSFGSAVYGKYVPDLKAVCVQLDVISQSDFPALQFLETLLHEEIHAAIHNMMGDDDDRLELTWLDELCAVLTSQHALRVAAQRMLSEETCEQVEKDIAEIRSKQKYGELAHAVLEETKDPLIALKAWQRIFELPDAQKRNYARDSVITPILHDIGWSVQFPYEYGDKYVTVFV